MWTTQDCHNLVLKRERLGKLAGQMRKPGLSDLVRCNYEGALTQAVMRSLAQLAANAARAGSLRHAVSGRKYPVFAVGYQDKNYLIVTRPAGDGRYSILGIQQAPLKEAEREDSPGARRANQIILNHLTRQLPDAIRTELRKQPDQIGRYLRVAGKQVDLSGRQIGNNEPDHSYVGWTTVNGKRQPIRVNVEVDTSYQGSNNHLDNVQHDHGAINAYVLVDATTGKMIGAKTIDSQGMPHAYTASNWAQLLRQLPKPVGKADPGKPVQTHVVTDTERTRFLNGGLPQTNRPAAAAPASPPAAQRTAPARPSAVQRTAPPPRPSAPRRRQRETESALPELASESESPLFEFAAESETPFFEFAAEDDHQEDYTGPAPWYSGGVTARANGTHAQNGSCAADGAYPK